MSRILKALLVAALLLVAFGSTSAHARNLNFLPGVTLLPEGETTLSYETREGRNVTLISCPMTLSMTYENGSIESEGGTFGTLTDKTVGTCSTGDTYTPLNAGIVIGRVLLEGRKLPGNPELVSGLQMGIAGLEFLIVNNGLRLRCLYRGTLEMFIHYAWRAELRKWRETSWEALPIVTPTTITTLERSEACPIDRLHIRGIWIPQNALLIGF